MKKCFFMIMICCFAFLFLARGIAAQEIELPVPKAFAPDPQKLQSGINVLEVVRGQVKIIVPIMKVQYEKEGLSNPEWQIFIRFAWEDKKGWQLESRDSYARETKEKDNFLLEALAVLPLQKGIDLYRGRLWIPAKNIENKYAWINQNFPCAREDEAGNLAYEFIVRRDGAWTLVPSNWPKWPKP